MTEAPGRSVSTPCEGDATIPLSGMVDRDQDDRDGKEPAQDGFRVEDRRSFDSGGERRPGHGRDAPQGAAGGGPEPETAPFLRLVGGLAASAYMALGAFPQPGGGEEAQVEQVDLDAAREVIDILGALHDGLKIGIVPEVIEHRMNVKHIMPAELQAYFNGFIKVVNCFILFFKNGVECSET